MSAPNPARNAAEAKEDLHAAIMDRLVKIAAHEEGVTETGENTGRAVKLYQRSTTLDGTGWPWCAAFVCWSIQAWLKLPNVAAALRLDTPTKIEAWRPKTPAAFGFETWARAKGLKIFDDDPRHMVKPGDLMTFDMSHIGIVVLSEPSRGIIHTIEGNTGANGSRDGQGVFRKARPRSMARRFIRILG